MAVNNNPIYLLKYLIPENLKKPEDLIIEKEEMSPPGFKIPPIIRQLAESISRDYVFEVGKALKEAVEAHLSFSLEQGITIDSCNDPRFMEVFEKNSTLSVVLPITDVKRLNISHLKLKELTAEKKQEALDHYQGKEVRFIDMNAFALWKADFKEPIQFDLKIQRHIALNSGGGLTTGYMRFPHLLSDLSVRFRDRRSSDQTKICLVGPGLLEENNCAPSCPQFVELLSLFPQAQFLLLDNNKQALTQIGKQLHESQLAYDPAMLRTYTFEHEENVYYALEKYQTLFREMKKVLAKKAVSPRNIKAMLQGNAALQPIMLKTDPEKIKLREFDINSCKMKEDENKTFDIIVATMSICNVILDQLALKPSYNSFSILGKFLAALKENGSLYVDALLIEGVLKEIYSQEGFNIGIQYLEILLGNRLAFEEIPISDFLPKIQGRLDTIRSLSINEAATHKPANVTTSSITVITRTAEKTKLYTKDESNAISLKLVQVLKAAKVDNINLLQSS